MAKTPSTRAPRRRAPKSEVDEYKAIIVRLSAEIERLKGKLKVAHT